MSDGQVEVMSSADEVVVEEGNEFVMEPPIENEVNDGELNSGGGSTEAASTPLLYMKESEDDGMASLREQIRALSTKLASKDREITVLKQRLTADHLLSSEHVFQLDGTVSESLLEEKFTSETIDMGGVKVVMNAEKSVDSEGREEIVVWFDLQSDSPYLVTLLTQIDVRGDCGTNFIRTPTISEFIRLSFPSSSSGTRHFVGKWQTEFLDKMYKYHLTLISTVKVMRTTRENSIDTWGENTATVSLGEENVGVLIPYLCEWSEYFRAFFGSPLNACNEEPFPVEECTAADFREMLDVIYPTSKPIDIWNVEKMLDLADRFIMPMLTQKCEQFLNERGKHNLSEIKMLQLADKFNLYYTKNVVLEKIPTFADLRSKIIKTEGYGSLSTEIKQAIDTRYVKLHVNTE